MKQIFVVLLGVLLLGGCDSQPVDELNVAPEVKPALEGRFGSELPAAFRGEWADNCDDKFRVMTLTGTMLSERDGDMAVDAVIESGPRDITVQFKNLQTSQAHMTLEDPKAPSTRPVLMWGTSGGEPVYYEKCD